MRPNHSPSRRRRTDLALVERCNNVDHPTPEPHHEPANQEHGNMHRPSLNCACDDTQNARHLNRLLSSDCICEPSHEEAAEKATTSEKSICRAGDARTFRRIGTRKRDVEVLEERREADD